MTLATDVSLPPATLPGEVEVRLPAALLRVYADRSLEDVLAAARRESVSRAGIHWLEPNLCAVLPIAADGSIFDLAATLACEILARSDAAFGHDSFDASRPGWGPRILIFPGRALVRGDRVELLPEPLLSALAKGPPSLAPGKVFLTSRAVTRLDLSWKLARSGFFDPASGARVPLLRLLPGVPVAPSARNPELLRRRMAYVPRPQLDAQLAQVHGSFRVHGSLGVGKGRSVAKALGFSLASPVPRATLWAQAQTVRQGSPPLAAQLLAQLLAPRGESGPSALDGLAALGLDPAAYARSPSLLHLPARVPAAILDPGQVGRLLPHWLAQLSLELSRGGRRAPLTVVLDQLEGATAAELGLVEVLLAAAHSSPDFRLALVGRPGAAWCELGRELPAIEVPALAAAETEALADAVFSGFDLPRAVRSRILAEAQGNPLVIEESLVALAHGDLIRQVYGSFFFSGPEDLSFIASDRLIQLVEADAGRAGRIEPLRLLACADVPLPASSLWAAGVADETADAAAPASWADAYLAAGWLAPRDSPWGPALTIQCPALGAALAATIPGEQVTAWRQRLGTELDSGSATAWDRYRLLAGTPEGVTALLEAAGRVEASEPERLLTALSAELSRGHDQALELRLLWQLLPLARRLDRLRQYPAELKRALALAAQDPRRLLAFAGLAAEIDEEEGRLLEAEATIRDGLRRGAGHDSQAEAVLALRLGRLLIRQERPEEARELLERVYPVLESRGANALQASCLFYLGNVASHQRRLEDARALHLRGLEIRRGLRGGRQVGASLSALGRVAQQLGRYPEALAYYRDAEQSLAGDDGSVEAAFAFLGLGTVFSRLGDFAAAAAPLRRALALREAREEVIGQAIARLAVAEHFLMLGRPDNALKEVRRAHFDLRLQPTLTTALGNAERLLGQIQLQTQQTAEAAEHFAAAAEIHQKLRDAEGQVLDLTFWLEQSVATGDETEARRLALRLEALLQETNGLERPEITELRVFQAWRWLARSAPERQRALDHLRSAYRQLFLKMTHLSQDQRHQFLFQVPDHQAIVAAATAEGMSFPGLPLPKV